MELTQYTEKRVKLTEKEKDFRQTLRKGQVFELLVENRMTLGVVEKRIKNQLMIRINRSTLVSLHVNSRNFVRMYDVNMKFQRIHVNLMQALRALERATKDHNTKPSDQPGSLHSEAMKYKNQGIKWLHFIERLQLVNSHTRQFLIGWVYSWE